jgi:antitoxin component of MazEF toxin-antitoxin module
VIASTRNDELDAPAASITPDNPHSEISFGSAVDKDALNGLQGHE